LITRRYVAPASAGARERVLRGLQNWAARQIEKRVRAEWEEYRRNPEVKAPLFRKSRAGAHVTRSLVQINFYKDRP
jgi:hypothetical protein